MRRATCHVARRTSHVHVARRTSHVARRTWHVARGTSTHSACIMSSSSASTPKATTSGTRPRARTRRSRTSTRCRGCTRSLRATACSRPTSSPTPSPPTRARQTCCRGCSRVATAKSAPTITPGRRRRSRRTTCSGIRMPRRCRGRSSRRSSNRSPRPSPARSAGGPCRIDPVASDSPPSTSPRSSARGYLVESSVAPLFYETHKGGPDFVEAPLTPYFLAYDSAVRPGSSNVLEVPVSAGLNRRLPAARCSTPTLARRAPTRRSGCCARSASRACAGCARRTRRSTTCAALARELARREVPVLNLLFHSSEAIVGGSPYNRTQGGARRVLRSARAVPGLCDGGAASDAGDVRRVPRTVLPPGLTPLHAHPPRHAAPAARPGGKCAAPLAARDVGARGR